MLGDCEDLLTPVAREEAVRRIAGHIADRDAFVVVGARVEEAPAWVERLVTADLPDWHVYLDSGGPGVRRVPGPFVVAALVADELFAAVSVPVAVVPKTVPAALLGEAIGQTIPEDGSQDLIAIRGSDGIDWPLLFVDALAVVDPGMAMQIVASDKRGLS